MLLLRTRYWPILVDVGATYLAFEVPFRVLFPTPVTAARASLAVVLSVIFAADLWNRLAHAPAELHPARLEGKARRRLHFSWGLVGDALVIIPMRIIAPGTPLELLRLTKVARVLQDLWKLRYQRIEYWTVFRLLLFAYWLALAVHWLSCGWIAIQEKRPSDDVWTTYILGLYWCITTLATVGYGDIVPSTNIERLYSMGVIIVGVGVYSFSIANVAAIVIEMKPSVARHMEQMQRVVSFMRNRRIPIELQHRIRDYFTFIWDKQLGSDEAALIAQLPQSLMVEVSMVLKRDIIGRVPFFKQADEQLLREISLEMRPVVFAPGDFICVAGAPGDEMYFIDQGTVEAVATDGNTILRTMSDGSFFGEIALLSDTPRTASVRAVEHCSLYALKREAVQRTASRYPDFARLLDEARREREK